MSQRLRTAAFDIFCYGEIAPDNIVQVPHLPSPERAVSPTGDSYHIGGGATNTAVWLAGLGLSVGLTGNAIGLDRLGLQFWEWLCEVPYLDLRYLERLDGVVTPFCRALVTPDGERSFLIYWNKQTPKTRLRPEMIAGCRFLVIDLHGGRERLEAARVAHAASVPLSVGDLFDLDHPLLPISDVITNSAAYIRERYPGTDIRRRAHELQAISGGIVVTTDGPAPVYAVDRTGVAYSVPPPAVPVVDTTGAGDAFRAGLLAGLLQGQNLARSLCWGVAAGTLSVQHLGAATALPPLAAVATLANRLEPT